MDIIPKDCCGCAACVAVCHQQAIQIEQDKMGFYYPKLFQGKCINCGACDRVCPVKEKETEKCEADEYEQKAFAVRHKKISEVKQSRSGAMFVALSDKVLENGGVVYGAGFTTHFRVVHKRAQNKKERDEFRGSKYAQSDMSGIFFQIKADLKNNKTVLFSGTPCQLAALNKYIPFSLKKKLICVDVICHGVASPKVWDDFITYVERKEGKSLNSVNFRDKLVFGWSGLHRESFVFSDCKTRTYPFTYYQPFLIRKCCNHCRYASLNRVSDITIGDFWGWEHVVPDMVNDDLGVSLVLCNTAKGNELFKSVDECIYKIKVPLNKCLQPNLKYPTKKDVRRDIFEADYIKYGFKYVLDKYWEVSFKDWIKHYVKRVLGK